MKKPGLLDQLLKNLRERSNNKNKTRIRKQINDLSTLAKRQRKKTTNSK